MLNGMHNCKPLQISNFDAVGFDLDHTLCKYNLVNLFHLTYDIATNHLVEKYHYPQRLLRTEGGNHKLYDFYFKGLQLDVKRGNFLKLSQNGHILRASHGTRMLNDEDIIKAYGRKRIWSDFENYKKSLTEHGVYVDYFQTPLVVTFAVLIDVLDEEQTAGHIDDYSEAYRKAAEPFRHMYFPDNFSEMKGSYFPSMVNRTEDYTFEASQRLRQWLQEMRAAGKITFLLTSSHIDYGSMLLKRILGKDWKLYFDVSFFRARKPLFFTDEDTAFHSITDELKEGPSVDSLKMHGCYLNGNWNLFRSFLKHESGMADPKVLYFGDSLPSDIVASRQFSDWTTVAIVEELETEELDTIERHISQADRNLLSSKQWGSFFYDNCPISGQVTNTFWHQVLRDNTPLVIPHMDTLTALPLDRAYNSCIFFPKPAFKDLP